MEGKDNHKRMKKLSVEGNTRKQSGTENLGNEYMPEWRKYSSNALPPPLGGDITD